MLTLLLSLLSAQASEACSPVTLRDLAALPSPGILVLGGNPGYATQLRRATRAVRALRDRGEPVTLAIEALPESAGGPIEQLQGPKPDLDAAREALRWDDRTDLPYAPYRPLLALGLSTVPRRVTLRPVGPPSRLSDLEAAELPTALIRRIGELEPTLSPTGRTRVAQARAASDAHIAQTALAGWSGEGHLVVVVDRNRVAGEGGLPWQLRERTSTPVWAATLDWREHDCVDGTWQWSEPTLRLAFPRLLTQPSKTDEPTGRGRASARTP
ncbi:MAG: hypothetical protein EA397_00875 [Deltaproteobacteria bacterium]|nr:MAG: hypothetical protein EA397_00875 [Deltaproteobacteria bacterium]